MNIEIVSKVSEFNRAAPALTYLKIYCFDTINDQVIQYMISFTRPRQAFQSSKLSILPFNL